ncbi:class D beta-lactamase [Candidatus Marinarcus aquaticus]|uniref:Beta-lactamase n=1 Tax=Candidatus Marinarcus aquaticus TaxID=2044504 RepID=A0A4Q0XU83_9BACT|nr:class D beta-lactamase [Candidatus Marinarcus aquaticus]RXJ60693.1 class D beta-lactamase [Candidatus Marinarcus aquaticus]
MRHWLRLLFLFPMCLSANDFALKELFELHDVKGTIVIESHNSGKQYIHNNIRAYQPMLAASTFKIPHTLIALNEGIIKDEKSPIIWDGKKRSMTVWNQNQTLKSAFSVSCVWCYQQFTENISKQKYENYLHQLHYGNEQTGENVKTFWLDGTLRITAFEQVAFLKKLYEENLPFNKQDILTVKTIMLNEESENYQLYAKTGWATSEGSYGWFVGYLKTSKDVWFFATNMDIRKQSELKLRKQITMEAFRLLGVI